MPNGSNVVPRTIDNTCDYNILCPSPIQPPGSNTLPWPNASQTQPRHPTSSTGLSPLPPQQQNCNYNSTIAQPLTHPMTPTKPAPHINPNKANNPINQFKQSCKDLLPMHPHSHQLIMPPTPAPSIARNPSVPTHLAVLFDLSSYWNALMASGQLKMYPHCPIQPQDWINLPHDAPVPSSQWQRPSHHPIVMTMHTSNSTQTPVFPTTTPNQFFS